MNIILASTSVYRKDLLKRLGIDFDCIAPDFDEDTINACTYSAKDLACLLAEKKAHSLTLAHPNQIIIGSDQVCTEGGEIFGKPLTHQKATSQLQRLSGKVHELITAVCVCKGENTQTFFDRTSLHMSQLSDDMIERYLKLDTPYHCAGSYKIESYGITLFDSIDTQDFNAITGLPLLKLSAVLKTLGVQPLEKA
ncbi:MAG: septum formation protein Maf [Bacteriovoracaceae bacterium]|jgi:septum formation protein|nr:septum formation protein Maf [Bacteriovoracaceae bacterium]